jgi:hypothetical protein
VTRTGLNRWVSSKVAQAAANDYAQRTVAAWNSGTRTDAVEQVTKLLAPGGQDAKTALTGLGVSEADAQDFLSSGVMPVSSQLRTHRHAGAHLAGEERQGL